MLKHLSGAQGRLVENRLLILLGETQPSTVQKEGNIHEGRHAQAWGHSMVWGSRQRDREAYGKGSRCTFFRSAETPRHKPISCSGTIVPARRIFPEGTDLGEYQADVEGRPEPILGQQSMSKDKGSGRPRP